MFSATVIFIIFCIIFLIGGLMEFLIEKSIKINKTNKGGNKNV